jgi:Holliday junction resolvasome RuvABC endonuclease subunit
MARLPHRGSFPKNNEIQTRTVITSQRHGFHLQRYKKILTEMLDFTEKRDVFFIEDYAFGKAGHQVKKTNTLVQLGELGGIIRMEIWRRTGRYPVPVAGGTWKKFLTGHGNARDREIQAVTFKKFRLQLGSPDEADALALAELGWCGLSWQTDLFPLDGRVLKDYEIQAIKALEKKAEFNLLWQTLPVKC